MPTLLMRGLFLEGNRVNQREGLRWGHVRSDFFEALKCPMPRLMAWNAAWAPRLWSHLPRVERILVCVAQGGCFHSWSSQRGMLSTSAPIPAWRMPNGVEHRARVSPENAPAMKNNIYLIAAAVLTANAVPVFAGEKPSKAPVPVESEDIWVHPITAPYWNEDSFVGNDIRAVFAHHHFPGAIFGGGNASVYAAQVRLKLLPNLQLVAYKDGYMDIDLKGYKRP